MNSLITPGRRRGTEILDDPAVKPDLMIRSMKDVERANSMFGGKRAVLVELKKVFRSLGDSASMLDVGTGAGDIPAAARVMASSAGVRLHTIGIDISEPLVSTMRSRNNAVLRGDARFLPFGDHSIDVVLASQVLHHFPTEQITMVLSEMNRVARRAVVISDLRRSRLAAAGLWLGSFPLGFHPVSRHDGVVSVMRGFVPRELADFVEAATGRRPPVKRRLGFRITAAWCPDA